MNRIVVIGNGFDKAHGMATGYKDFIDKYWEDFSYSIFNGYRRYIMETFGVINSPQPYEDEFILFEISHKQTTEVPKSPCSTSCENPYSEVMRFILDLNMTPDYQGSIHLTFKNQFFKHISEKCSLCNWLDIENEYYGRLKDILTENDTIQRNQKVRELNTEFEAIRKRLEKYLTDIVDKTQIQPLQSIRSALDTLIEPNEIAYEKQPIIFESIVNKLSQSDFADGQLFRLWVNTKYFYLRKQDRIRKYIYDRLNNDAFKKQYYTPDETLILNFNYTATIERLYAKNEYEIINIHGELGNNHNRMIFGYGDEIDDDYKIIEKVQDNDFLENIKSIRYHETDNYRRLLAFIASEPYQVIIMGHSCGNSDRTLLNTLFEHQNCVSVKVYYHQREDGSDDYSNLIRNISRNFNDKAAMRDKVVNKEKCLPLVPRSLEQA